MNELDHIAEIISTYQRHGWQLRRVLCRAEIRAAVDAHIKELFAGASVHEATLNALWFARPSPGGREAWELRLVAEPPYALFETFEADEADEDREDMRLEMEARINRTDIVPAAFVSPAV